MPRFEIEKRECGGRAKAVTRNHRGIGLTVRIEVDGGTARVTASTAEGRADRIVRGQRPAPWPKRIEDRPEPAGCIVVPMVSDGTVFSSPAAPRGEPRIHALVKCRTGSSGNQCRVAPVEEPTRHRATFVRRRPHPTSNRSH